MDLAAFYGMQQGSNFLPYLSLYQPYNNFSMASDQNYFGHFTSQLNSCPTFDYYMCLDAKNLYASLFGKQCTYFLERCLLERYYATFTNNIECLLVSCFFQVVQRP